MDPRHSIETGVSPRALISQRVEILCAEDIPVILELEDACWLPAIRAREETLRKRFELGHISMGIFDFNQLVGLTSFSYTRFSPDNLDGLPGTFNEFSSRPRCNDYNTAYVYNLNIHPDYRGKPLTRKLVWATVDQFRKDNCSYLLGASRCPSYNGSQGAGTEAIQPSRAFRNTIDDSVVSGMLPATRELTVDPVLRFYRRMLGCTFLRVAPDFLPGDTPSGDFGVIFYKAL